MHNTRDQNNKEKKVLLLFLHNSTGELFVALPMIWFLKKYMDIDVYFVSSHKDILKRMNVDKRYIEIMNKVGTMHFGLKSYLLLSKLRFLNRACILMSCNAGSRRIDDIFYTFLKKSTKVFFLHAYMLHPLNNIKTIDEPLLPFKRNFTKSYGMSPDILINVSEESNYFINRGWSTSSIHAVGALGYSETWFKFLFNVDSIQKEKKTLNKSYKIFVPLRDSHWDYLTEANYNYQINSLAKIFKNFPSLSFIVKLHPRQSLKQLEEVLGKYDNVTFSTKSPFELAQNADLTLGFWSSASTDSVAVGTPAVEFHKHEIPHSQLIKKDGKLISIIEYLELCRGFDDASLLEVFLKELSNEKLQALHKTQYQNLSKIYNLDADYKNLIKIFDLLFRKASKAHKEQKNDKKIPLFLFQKTRTSVSRLLKRKLSQ